jgi:hypothetical protein
MKPEHTIQQAFTCIGSLSKYFLALSYLIAFSSLKCIHTEYGSGDKKWITGNRQQIMLD